MRSGNSRKKMKHGIRLLLALASSVVMFTGQVAASPPKDHDLARQALEAGEILPLRTVLERIARDYPGEVMEVELEQDNGKWTYEIKMIRRGGGIAKLKLNAKDASLIEIRDKNTRQGKHREENR